MASPFNAETTLFDRQTDFWANYRAGRPVIPDSFYQRFYDYHAAHGGSFGTVHDVGAGFGELSVQLAKRFKHVVISDPAPKTLSVAQDFTKAATDRLYHFTFRQERIEDSDLPKASVDAIFSCNAIHWTDLEKAMGVMASQLKPGGSLFICLNGIPKFDPKIQPVWWRMIDACIDGAATRMPKAALERVLLIQDSGYDCIALPESDFEPGAIRLKLNTLGNPDAFVMAPRTKNVPRISRIGANDKLEESVDKDWFFETDLEGLRATVGSYPLDPDPEMLERHLAELGALLGDGLAAPSPYPLAESSSEDDEEESSEKESPRPYDYIRAKSIALVEREHVHTVITPFIHNARVLELACGSGFYTSHWLPWGAHAVVAVSLSPVMLAAARRACSTASTTSSNNGTGTVDFIQADCSKPTPYPGGPFDVVFAAWLLNYAPDRGGLVDMFRHVALNLRDGGHFVSVTFQPTHDPAAALKAEYDARPPPEGSGGLWYSVLGDVEDGIYMHIHGDTPMGDIGFNCWWLRRDAYESAAREAGLEVVEWGLTSVPERYLQEGAPGGSSLKELESYTKTTNYGVLVITK